MSHCHWSLDHSLEVGTWLVRRFVGSEYLYIPPNIGWKMLWMVLGDLAGAKLRNAVFMRGFLRVGLIEGRTRPDVCNASNKIESDWQLSLDCCRMIARVLLDPMDLGQAIHTCSFHGSIVGWTVSRTVIIIIQIHIHSAIFSSCNRGVCPAHQWDCMRGFRARPRAL